MSEFTAYLHTEVKADLVTIGRVECIACIIRYIATGNPVACYICHAAALCRSGL